MKEELIELQGLVNSKGWKYYKQILSNHKMFLQKEVNKYIRNKQWEDAFGALSKYDDIDKQLDLLSITIKKLSEEE